MIVRLSHLIVHLRWSTWKDLTLHLAKLVVHFVKLVPQLYFSNTFCSLPSNLNYYNKHTYTSAARRTGLALGLAESAGWRAGLGRRRGGRMGLGLNDGPSLALILLKQ